MYTRICNCGCGQPLVKADGSPDFKRHFRDHDCKNLDEREKKRYVRARAAERRCSKCGRSPRQKPCVARDTGQGEAG